MSKVKLTERTQLMAQRQFMTVIYAPCTCRMPALPSSTSVSERLCRCQVTR